MKRCFINKTFINIKREIINVTPELKNFIFDNINYSRKVWNEFVEESKKYYDLTKFNPIQFNTEMYSKKGAERAYRKSEYEYCEGINRTIARRTKDSIKKCIKRGKEEHKHCELRFKKFDKYYGSFTVDARVDKVLLKDGSTRIGNRIFIANPREFIFRAHKERYIPIELQEPLYYDIDHDGKYILDKNNFKPSWNTSKINKRCRYRIEDVRQITFIHEIGHFYIMLSVNVDYYIKHEELKKRKNVAGIDLGIHNPCVIMDESGNVKILKMSEKQLNRIHYLERRISKLQKIMDNKYLTNKKMNKPIYSKNYEKLHKKIRISWNKIKNIRKDWIRKSCKFICTNYKLIVVDNFKIPPQKSWRDLPRSISRKLNSFNRLHAMSYFIDYLKYASIKYGCVYILAEKGTTCTCNNCGHKNPHLQLTERFFVCEKCGFGKSISIDRDFHAAKNCYDQGIDYMASL